MTTLTPLLQKANLVFGMGMLEMGITFSFKQLILDSAIVADLRDAIARTQLPIDMDSSNYVKDLVAMYKGETPPLTQKYTRSFWQGAENIGTIEARADNIANEIINTHRIPAIDRSILNQLRRIVLSAE